MGRPEGGDISYRDMLEVEQHSPVKDFFEKSVVFITGATGFMGKVLIEKLLRTCPALPKMYILARPKKGKDIGERFKEQFSDPLYQRLKREQPDFLTKLYFVPGDVSLINLGLSEDDYNTLTSEVNVIFHGAATVRFDERLQHAVRVNVRGTREIMTLAKKCQNLTALLHVSTAYANCVSMEIDEKFYDPPISPENLINVVESLDEEMSNKIAPTLLGKFPNTYAFTKMVAEAVVKNMSKGLPVAVLRPAIIISSSREPVQGWIDNVYGPTGVIVGAGLGLLRSLHCDGKIVADIIPVDYVINATIVAAYQAGHSHEAPNKENLPKIENGMNGVEHKFDRTVPVYNYVSSNDRPITWGMFMKLSEKHGWDIPTTMSLWYYSFTLNRYRFVHLFYVIFMHLLPAYIVDGLTFLVGKKPSLVKGYAKIHKFCDVISYFSTKQWKFHNNNVKHLSTILTQDDRDLFDFDISQLNWDDFFYTYLRGMRLYLIKDDFETIPQGRKKRRIHRIAHYTIIIAFWSLLLRFLWFCLTRLDIIPF